MAKYYHLGMNCTVDTIGLLREIFQNQRYNYLQFNKSIKLESSTTLLKYSVFNLALNPPPKEQIPKFKKIFAVGPPNFDRELRNFIITL